MTNNYQKDINIPSISPIIPIIWLKFELEIVVVPSMRGISLDAYKKHRINL